MTPRDDDTTDARFGECVHFDCKDPSALDFGYTDYDRDDDDDDGDDFSMSFEFFPWEQDEEPVPTVDGAVEIGDKTGVFVTATGYDVRPGVSSGMVGCGEAGGDGCAGPRP